MTRTGRGVKEERGGVGMGFASRSDSSPEHGHIAVTGGRGVGICRFPGDDLQRADADGEGAAGEQYMCVSVVVR
jgi:hypothetical protein